MEPASEPVGEGELTLVVSDLHLGADPELDDFYSDLDFADFLRFHSQAPGHTAPVHLVINGDLIDFLQIDPRGQRRIEHDQSTPLWLSEAEAVESIEQVAARHHVFFAALAGFARAEGHRVSVLRGNHDMELAWPRVLVRLRELCGSPPEGHLDFPLDAIFDEPTGLYIEHGAQYDPLNASHDLRDPFLDRRRRRLDVPVGSVLVKVFWNRVEREFPHIDKIRPMWDSVSSLLVQRPTYLFLRFDYFVDLAWGIARSSASGLLRLWPRSGGPPPTGPGDPRTLGQRLARPGGVGRWAAMVVLTFAAYLVMRGALIWDEPGMREARVVRILSRLFKDFAFGIGASFGTVIAARLLRRLLHRVATLGLIRNVFYRLTVAAASGLFFWAILKMFWIPIGGIVAFYVLVDAARGVTPAVAEEALGAPAEPEVMAALRLLRHERIRTVIFGHTHVPMQIDLPSGKRYINSGTWVKVVDLRNARTAPNELNTYVAIRGGEAALMSWRGTEPARRFGTPTVLPQIVASASMV